MRRCVYASGHYLFIRYLNRIFYLRVRCLAKNRRSCFRDLGSIITIFHVSSEKGAL